MKTAERLIFLDGTYEAGTPCEVVPWEQALASVGPIARLGLQLGELQVVRLAGRLRIVDAAAVEGA